MKQLYYFLFLTPILFQAEIEAGVARGMLEERQTKIKKLQNQLSGLHQKFYKELSNEKKEQLQKNYQSWRHSSTFKCGWRAEMEAGKEPAKKDSYETECKLNELKSRIEFTRGVMKYRNARSLSGGYSDGLGGRLKIIMSKNNRVHFKLNVSRGPTVHVGEVSGYIRLSKKWYEFDRGKDEDRCRLRFRLILNAIEVIEDGRCKAFHGHKAYFDGVYHMVNE